MLNILKSEFLKLKKDTMFFTGTFISVITPAFLIVKDKYLSVPPNEITEWVMSCCLVNFMIFSVLSGFIITNLVQKEYQSGTIINILSSSVSRIAFVCSKLAIWFLWYAVVLIFIEIVTLLGGKLIYPSQFNVDFIKMVIVMFSKFGFLSFISFIPLLWITILQRKLFYPSILAAIGFTGFLLGGFNISSEMILSASIVPWMAVSLVSVYQVESLYIEIGLIAIILTGLMGLFFSCYSFYKQDQ